MSDALSPNAPVEGAAAPEAPAPEVAVDGASAGAEEPKVVPAERFNGLQSRYQSDKAEWERRQAAMEAELNSLRAKEQEKPEPVSDDVAELKGQVQQLTELLLSERAESARERVLDQYPDAKPFADLIVGNTVEEMEQVAKALHDRMQLIKGETAPTTEPTADGEPAPAGSEAPAEGAGEPAPAAPEHGGAVPATGVDTLVEAKNQAIADRNFEAFLAAQSALAEREAASVG
jgi:hypothetical protein